MNSRIQREIAVTKATAARRLARLREQERRYQDRLDARVLKILRQKIRPSDLAAIEVEARAQLDAEIADRSKRARDSRSKERES